VGIGAPELQGTEDKRSESSDMYGGGVHGIGKAQGSWNGWHCVSQRREGAGFNEVGVYL
jgi:hypothetical protein